VSCGPARGGPWRSRSVFARAKRSLSAGPTSTSTPAPCSSGEAGYARSRSTGRPLNHRTDYDEWKRLLVRAVMGLMGWSNSAMAARYQHITKAVQRDVARRVGGLLWQAEGRATDGN